MSLSSGIGLAALIIAVIGIFIPVVGLFIGWFALLIALVAALTGDKGLSIATVVVSALGFALLTPSLWVEAGASSAQGSPPVLRILTIILLLAPVAGMILFSTGKLALGKSKSGTESTSS